VVTPASGQLTLGESITVSLRFGSWAFSAGLEIHLTCDPPIIPVTVYGVEFCENIEGEIVAGYNVTIDPSAGATVSVYSDAAMTELVASHSQSETFDGLTPGGTYWYKVEVAEGYELEGEGEYPTEGSFTVEDCRPSAIPSISEACNVDTSQWEVSVTNNDDESIWVEIDWGSDDGVNEELAANSSATYEVPTETQYDVYVYDFDEELLHEAGYLSGNCDEVLGTTVPPTIAPTVVDSTLPFTGIESGQMAGIAIMLLGTGLLLTLVGRGRREEG